MDAGFIFALPFHHGDLEPDFRSSDEGGGGGGWGILVGHYGIFSSAVPWLQTVNHCFNRGTLWLSGLKNVMIEQFSIHKYCDIGSSSFPDAAEVWFSLKNKTYRNNSCVTLEDIGEGGDALLCMINFTACCGPPFTGESGSVLGNWFFPNGTSVSNDSNQWDFYKTRGQMVVYLNHRRGGEDGIYRCEIPDSTDVIQTIYIGVYTTSTSTGK